MTVRTEFNGRNTTRKRVYYNIFIKPDCWPRSRTYLHVRMILTIRTGSWAHCLVQKSIRKKKVIILQYYCTTSRRGERQETCAQTGWHPHKFPSRQKIFINLHISSLSVWPDECSSFGSLNEREKVVMVFIHYYFFFFLFFNSVSGLSQTKTGKFKLRKLDNRGVWR